MSVEASATKIRDFMAAFAEIGEALDVALVAEAKAKNAEKRALAAQDACAKALDGQNAALEAGERLRAEAAKIMADAKADAAAIRKEAKTKADAAVASAKDKADAIAEATATAQEKFQAQKQTNDEILAMTQAQIAHAEAKLKEIREAIAALTKA